MDPQRLMDRLDAMVANGRVTPDEADRLRAAEGTPEFDRVVAAIRVRHASAHTAPAVAEGRMRQDEAEDYLARVGEGEHSNALRKAIRGKH